MKINSPMNKRRINRSARAFTLLEVLVALAIAVLMLGALINLQLGSARLLMASYMGFMTLPVAIDKVEELSTQSFFGEESQDVGDYRVHVSSRQVYSDVNLIRIKVEVWFQETPYSDLSIYTIQQ